MIIQQVFIDYQNISIIMCFIHHKPYFFKTTGLAYDITQGLSQFCLEQRQERSTVL